MTEFYQDFNIYFHKTSKEARDDFLKYYLDNIDRFPDYDTDILHNEYAKQDPKEQKPFKIFDYKNYSRDHNSSLGLIKPQFLFIFPTYHLTVMIDLTQSMLWTTSDGDVKLERGLEIFKDVLHRTIHKKNNYNPNVIINIFCFRSSKLVVIIKGWELQSDNFESFYKSIIQEIYKNISSDLDKSINNIFNIIREGVISLNLSENDNKSFSNLVLITDANFPIPDGLFLDKLIALLRFCSVSCSFIHVSSENEVSNFSSIIDQGNGDQLKFIANVTGGFYTNSKDFGLLNDKYILSYQFFDQSEYVYLDTITLKHFNDKNLNIPPLNLILSLINSGYFLNSLNILRDSRCEIELQLPWRSDVYFRANIVSKFPIDQHRKCSFSLSICANSYFLHCISKMSMNSELADVNIQRFSAFLNETKTYIYFMEYFSQFNLKPMCTIPNFINGGLKPMLSPTNQPCDKIDKIPKTFFDFWKRALDLEYLTCLHSTKISLLLEHDYPFPEYLSTRDPVSHRYGSIQCREGLVQLSTLINKNFCSFVVKENSTYVKFFFHDSTSSITPNYFCIIKLLIKDFEAKLFLNFFIHTPDNIRDEFVANLTNSIGNLRFPPRGKQARPRHMSSQMAKTTDHVPPQQRSWEQIHCCIVLNLDLDNLIATYNPIKSVDANNSSNKRSIIRQNPLSLSMIYLQHQCHHEYSVWNINHTFLDNIFETLIKVRLQEGFHFAHCDSSSGFINLIKQIELVNNCGNSYHSFIQYMIYLDTDNTSIFGSEELAYVGYPSRPSCKIFTEILVERKDGSVTNCDPEVAHWSGLLSQDLPQQIIALDQKCLETFVTFECFQIYPASLPRSLVKPNICSVLINSSRVLLHCPLLAGDIASDHWRLINSVFMEALDRNLKLHGFHHIDITKTENANFNELLQLQQDEGSIIVWHCYYAMRGQYLAVIMLPSNHIDCCSDRDTNSGALLPLFVYGMSLKHLAFLIEDRWTLQLPANREFTLPLRTAGTDTEIVTSPEKSATGANNEFTVEMHHIQQYLRDHVKKLDSIYVLTFVGAVHKNLRENRLLNAANLRTVFNDYCSELSCYDVDATAFMNTICSHCSAGTVATAIAATTTIAKECCESKPGMHSRIVKRIRSMMAKYFKEIPSFPQILIYCPENETESIMGTEPTPTVDASELAVTNETDQMSGNYHRQLSSQQQEFVGDVMDFVGCDSLSDLDGKSIGSIVAMDNYRSGNCCPLFISIHYTLKYESHQRSLHFDTIPTCIGEFIDEVRSITDGLSAGTDVDYDRLRFHLDMIPITVIDEDCGNSGNGVGVGLGCGNETSSVTVEAGRTASGRKRPSDTAAKACLSPLQTQLLTNCRNELVWTLDDEIVNCVKYAVPVQPSSIDTVMRHIDGTLQHKWHRQHAMQVQKRRFELEFVFGWDKSKALFQDRLEKLTFGKSDQYQLEKIGRVYCVFQRIKFVDEQVGLGLGLGGLLQVDQTITDMDDVYSQSRMRYATMCLNSRTQNDEYSHMQLRRWSSDSKLCARPHSRKMSSEPQERQSFALFNSEKSNVQIASDLAKPIEFRQITNIITQTNQCNNANQVRSPMPYAINQQSASFTPRRHRSGEASSTMYPGNCRSDTPMLLNDLISTATSSKGYEGDSSRVSDGEDCDMIDHFSNFAVDNNKIDNNKIEMAPFWLLLNIIDCQKQIELYFHHTDNCWLTVPNYNFPICDHCSSFESIFDKFSDCVHQVNQCLLLEQLAHTRFCKDILVPQDSADQKLSAMSQLLDCDYDDESTELQKKFTFGAFACPKILKISFRLHSRLRGSPDKNAKAIPLLRIGLENIAVLNRKNMLIFVDDDTKGIFYSIMRETTGNLDQEEIERLHDKSVLISYSTNQLSRTVKIEEMLQQKISDNCDMLSTKSAPSYCDSKLSGKPGNSNMIHQYRNIELLELSVYGVNKLSETTTKSIISDIGSKLDLIVLRKLSESICRSRAILLNKEDIDFLLSEDFHNKPQKPTSFSWSMPRLVIDNKLAFCYYLKQNLQFGFISPKICDRLERFYLNAEGNCETYLYNQTAAQGVSNEVIALFTLQLMTGVSQSSCVIRDWNLPQFQLADSVSIDNIIKENHVQEIDNNNVVIVNNNGIYECYLHFNLWVRGLVDVDIIKKKILNAIQYALNDLFMEYIIIPCPISSFNEELLVEIRSNECNVDRSWELNSKITAHENGGQGNLNSLFADSLFRWMPELSKNECPLLKYRRFEMFSDFNVEFFLNDLVESMNDYIHLNAFYCDSDVWCPWNAQFPKSGKDYPGVKRSFVVIGRLEELWKRYVGKRCMTPMESENFFSTSSQTSLPFTTNSLGASLNSSTSSNQANNMKELRKVRTLLKQPPFDNSLLNVSNTPSTTNVLNSNNLNSGMPEFCNVEVSSSVIIPRQMLCIVKIHGCQIDTITYNLAKEISDHLYNSVDSILKNHKSRFQMLNSFIYQKLGIFYECSNRSCLQGLSVNTVKSLLVIPSFKTKPLNTNIGELSRERKPSGSPRSFSPSSQVSMKNMSTSQVKSTSSKNNLTKTININVLRIYQDAYTVYQLSEIKKPDTMNDIIFQHAYQFLNTYQLEFNRRLLSKKVRQSINSLQPTIGFKQSEFNEPDYPLQQLDVFSCLKRACRIFHSVVCPILFIPNVRKRFLNTGSSKPSDPNDHTDEHSTDDDWIHEMSRLVLAHYADYVQKEHGFQFINPPRSNISLHTGSHALFQKLSNNSGIHLIEVFILKDCMCVRLNLLEIRRLTNCVPGLTSTSSNFQHIQHVQKSFVKDACKFCDLTHLMSFMYDVYVKMIAKAISYPEENKKSFNPISFLRDLVKMYDQPPLYATSHLYLMPFPVPNDVIKPENLFEFLQRHYEDYNFSINNNHLNQTHADTSTAFLYNIIEESYLSPNVRNSKKISPTSSSPLDIGAADCGIYYKISDNVNEWAFTSIFCLTRSQQHSETCFDLFIITLNRTTCFPHQRLIAIPNNYQKSSTILANYLTILPHHSTNPANLLHANPCPISITRIDVNNIPESISWRTYENRSIVPLQAPLFLTLRTCIDKYLRESNEKFSRAITDCHKDSLWQRMYQQSEITDSSRFSLSFDEFQDLINSGDIVDILELDNRLVDSMKIAAAYLKELNDYMGVLSDDCYTVFYENTTSLYRSVHSIISSHLVLMSKKTNDGFLLLSKNDDYNCNPDNYSVQLKAVFRAQDCRTRIPPQHKYFSSSLRDITVMLAETAAFCIWRKLATKPLTPGK